MWFCVFCVFVCCVNEFLIGLADWPPLVAMCVCVCVCFVVAVFLMLCAWIFESVLQTGHH